MAKNNESNILADNGKAFFDYEILETFQSGIELIGFEVKAFKAHKATLEGAYVTIRGGEAYLMQASVPPYQASNTPENYDPLRMRRLLLTKEEITKLGDIEATKGLTIVPIRVYTKNRRIKVDIAVVRGKKKFDKRQSIKKRETDIEIRRTLKYKEE